MGVLGLFLWLGFKVFDFSQKELIPTISCAYNIRIARDAVLLYAKDHGGRLPNAATWQDDVRRYFDQVTLTSSDADEFVRRWKADGEWACKLRDRTTSVAFNSDLSGKLLSEISDPTRTVLLFEVARTGTNLNEKYKPSAKETSPKVMGEPRGWISAPVEGDVRAPNSRVEIEVGGSKSR